MKADQLQFALAVKEALDAARLAEKAWPYRRKESGYDASISFHVEERNRYIFQDRSVMSVAIPDVEAHRVLRDQIVRLETALKELGVEV